MKRAPNTKRSGPTKPRKSPRKQGYSSRWDRIAKHHREHVEQMCRECLRIWDKPVLAAACDHIIPFDGPDDPMLWDPDNRQSLCLGCHGLKSWRERMGWVIDWAPIESRIVITGKTATGKSWYGDRLKRDGFSVWDMDEVAAELGYRPEYPRPPYQKLALLENRARYVERAAGDGENRHAVICTAPSVAYKIVKRLRGRLVHTWCSEALRAARLIERAQI